MAALFFLQCFLFSVSVFIVFWVILSPQLSPVRRKKVIYTETEYKPQLGGKDSGRPPLFVVGSGLHSHAVIGLDLGNYLSRMAAYVDGELRMICNPIYSYMEETQRSAVSFDDVDKQRGKVGFARCVRSKIGTDWSCELSGQAYNAPELTSILFAYLKKLAEERLARLVSGAVITVPNAYTAAQRESLILAAQDAGLNVLQLVNEPSCVALQHCVLNKNSEGRYFVISFGAGVLSIITLENYHGIVEVKSSSGDGAFGGEDFDNVLVEWLIERAEIQNGVRIKLDEASLERFRRAAEQARKDLVMSGVANIQIANLHAAESGFLNILPRQYNLIESISLQEYHRLVDPLLKRLRAHIEEALETSGFEANDVQYVLLHGGLTQSRDIGEIVRDYMPYAEYLRMDDANAAAYGAAVQANLITYGVRDYVLWDVLGTAIGVERPDGSFREVVAKNTPLPVRAYHQVPVQGATAMAHILQGNSHRALENASLAEVVVNNCPPAHEGEAAVEVGLIISADGRIDYTSRHCELMSTLPISIRLGERNIYRNRVEDLLETRRLSREPSTERLDRLSRKLNVASELLPKTLRDIGYSPASIRSGFAIEHMLSKLKKTKKQQAREGKVS